MRVERLKKVPEKAAGLGPRAFVLVLLIPEKIGRALPDWQSNLSPE
jgi:hypothetical protein